MVTLSRTTAIVLVLSIAALGADKPKKKAPLSEEAKQCTAVISVLTDSNAITTGDDSTLEAYAVRVEQCVAAPDLPIKTLRQGAAVLAQLRREELARAAMREETAKEELAKTKGTVAVVISAWHEGTQSDAKRYNALVVNYNSLLDRFNSHLGDDRAFLAQMERYPQSTQPRNGFWKDFAASFAQNSGQYLQDYSSQKPIHCETSISGNGRYASSDCK